MKLLVETKTGLKLTDSATKMIVELETKIKELQTLEVELKRQIIEQMKNHECKSIENDLLRLTFIESTTRESFDSKLLKSKFPDIYNNFKRTSDVAETVKITCK